MRREMFHKAVIHFILVQKSSMVYIMYANVYKNYVSKFNKILNTNLRFTQTSQPEMRFCSETSSIVAWKLQLGSNQ